MIFLSEKLEINSIDSKKSETTPEKIIQVNLAVSYDIKLCKTISTHSAIEDINTHYFQIYSLIIIIISANLTILMFQIIYS